MKHVNGVVQRLLYKHKDTDAKAEDLPEGTFYRVPQINQEHANLCGDASMNMLYKAGDRPFASMSKNPRTAFDGKGYDGSSDFRPTKILLNNPDESSVAQEKRVGAKFHEFLDKKGPFVLNLGLRGGGQHAVLVTGMSGDKIVYNDPLTGSNKILTTRQVCDLYGKDDDFIDVINQNFMSQEKLDSLKSKTLPEQEIVKDPKYKDDFTLEKMKKPCDALREFLDDSVKRGKTTPEEKQKLSQFLESHKDTDNIATLMTDLRKEFPDGTTSKDLFNRLQSANHYMNTPEGTPEIKKNDVEKSNSANDDLLFGTDNDIPKIKPQHASSEALVNNDNALESNVTVNSAPTPPPDKPQPVVASDANKENEPIASTKPEIDTTAAKQSDYKNRFKAIREEQTAKTDEEHNQASTTPTLN